MIRTVAFGTGHFLRGFWFPFVDQMNRRAGWDARVTVVKPTAGPLGPGWATVSEGYHLSVKGIRAGESVRESAMIRVVDAVVHPGEDFEAFLALARDPDVRVVVSNTTEAGLATDPGDGPGLKPSPSFPAKLARFLRERYLALGPAAPALVVLPFELVETNGALLRSLVGALARAWYADLAFEVWLGTSCLWYDTLVDRIVPGHDADQTDPLATVAEPYHLLVLQGPEREDLLPLCRSGLNVVWTDNLNPWRERKVRVLNGGHTFLALEGTAAGFATVGEALDDAPLRADLSRFWDDEVLPFLAGDPDQLRAYRDAVVDRFANPFVNHQLSAILLNTPAKFRARIVPSARAYAARHGRPAPLCARLQALAGLPPGEWS